ncbi:hypothetical protein BC835DRAFT_1205883, partial [Cytidiella melzeri]
LLTSPRLRFSDAQISAMLRWAKALHARDVPTLYAIKKMCQDLRRLVGDPTKKVVSPSGNIFYINDIGAAVAKDYANPLTRFAMSDFPEDRGGYMSEAQHGFKMLRDGPEGIVTPAVRVEGKIFFTQELLQRSDTSYFIPERFFVDRCSSRRDPIPTAGGTPETLTALGRSVSWTERGFVVSNRQMLCPVATFKVPFDKLYGSYPEHVQLFSGMMCYAVPVIVFIDDVSGNVSKQWNKHHVVYASNANLPREMIEKEFSVKFVSSSPHASPIELAKAVCDSINSAAQNGVEAWDCKYDEEVLLLPYGFFFGGDNPMQAEECSHNGLGCNLFCRTCKVGGTKAHKASEEGFLELFSEGPLRTLHETDAEIRRQLSMSVLPGAQSKVDSACQATGVWDSGLHSIIHTLIEMGKQLRKARP